MPSVLLRVVLLLLAQGLQGYLLNGRPGHIEWAVLPDLLFPVGLLWLSSWVVVTLAGQPERAAALLAELLGARVLIAVLQGLVLLPGHLWPADERLDAPIAQALDAIQIWWLLAVLARITRCFSDRRPRVLLAIGAFAGPWLVLLALFQPADLWQGEAAGADAGPAGQAMSEAVFYGQQGLMDDALDALEGDRPGLDDLYFLGVAGDAGTRAFRNEVEMAGRLFDERFDTRGRSLLLANDGGPEPRHPFATHSNLDTALARFADLMDVDDDILVLFLSSHGTREHSLVLAQPALALTDIDPAGLRASLDDSGIRWRVVIVSACYSGGFIDALRDEHTAIITASDADHPSFGCGVSDQYTWFGQALFDDQLRKTFSLTEAFQGAARAVAAREKSMGEQPSNPQLVVGSAMGAKLAALQARLSQPGGPGESVQAAAGRHGLAPAALHRTAGDLRGTGAHRHAFPGQSRIECRRWLQAGMSGVRRHANAVISSLRRSFRFFSRRRDSSSMLPSPA